MTTWNVITIHAALTEKQIKKLPDRDDDWMLGEGDDWQHNFPGYEPLRNGAGGILRDIRTGLPRRSNTPKPPTETYCAGESKYRRDEIEEWVVKWTTKHPGISVTWTQEWDDDGAGWSSDVYRDGALVREESTMSGTVPLDVVADCAAIRALLRKGVVWRPQEVIDRVTRLIDVLSPERTPQ